MKKVCLLIFCVLTLSWQGKAQRDTVLTNHHEVSFVVGGLPISLVNYKVPLLETIITPAFSISYVYRFTKVIGLSIIYTYAPKFEDIEYTPLHEEKLIIGRENLSTHTLMPMLKVNWLNTKYVDLYSKAGIGLMYLDNRFENYYPNRFSLISENKKFFVGFQIIFAGIEIGTNQYAGFLQYGLGCQGYLAAGFRLGL